MKLNIKNTSELELPPGSTDAVFWDDNIPGFGVRVRAGGSRNWVFRYRIGKKQRAIKLGSVKAVPLAVARQNARELAAKIALGADPALAKETSRLEADNTFGVLANQYLEARKSNWRPKSLSQFARHLLKYAKPLHPLPITAVEQRNIANLLTKITRDSGEATSNRVRSTLCALFSWALKEGIRLPEGNVAAHTNKHEEKSRERVLTNPELKAIWDACRDNDFGAIVKLLLLTGQRKSEIGFLRWDEVRDEEIVLPAERTKNKRAHTIPISDPAKANSEPI